LIFLVFVRTFSLSSFRKGKLRESVGREGTGPHLVARPPKDSRTVEGS
jgi:hypothetical protein